MNKINEIKGFSPKELYDYFVGVLDPGGIENYKTDEWAWNVETRAGRTREYWPVDDLFIEADGSITCLLCGVWRRHFKNIEEFRKRAKLVRRKGYERGTVQHYEVKQ